MGKRVLCLVAAFLTCFFLTQNSFAQTGWFLHCGEDLKRLAFVTEETWCPSIHTAHTTPDQICRREARQAGLFGHRFKAMLTRTYPSHHLFDLGESGLGEQPFFDVNNSLLVNDPGEMFFGDLLAPVNVNAEGDVMAGDVSIWTDISDCGSDRGTIGFANTTDGDILRKDQTVDCGVTQFHHILCLEDPESRGVVRVAAVPVAFADSSMTEMSVEEINELVFGGIGSFRHTIALMSYEQMTIEGETFEWLMLEENFEDWCDPDHSSDCLSGSLGAHISNFAFEQLELWDYDVILFFADDVQQPGIATVGGYFRNTPWGEPKLYRHSSFGIPGLMRGSRPVSTILHEFGHNFELRHAGEITDDWSLGLTCHDRTAFSTPNHIDFFSYFLIHGKTEAERALVMPPGCMTGRYTDNEDSMGVQMDYSNRNSYSAYRMEQLGWLHPEQIEVVWLSGEYDLVAMESSDCGIRELHIRLDNDFNYSIEMSNGINHGVFVRVIAPHLIDRNTILINEYSWAYGEGDVIEDRVRGIEIEVLTVGEVDARVQITFEDGEWYPYE